MKTVCVCAIMTMCGLLKKMMWREPDDELIWILRRRSNRKNITFLFLCTFSNAFPFKKKKNISVIDMYSMKLNLKEYLWHWIWHACMTCFIRWLHFGKANIIHNLYLYMWFVSKLAPNLPVSDDKNVIPKWKIDAVFPFFNIIHWKCNFGLGSSV